MYHLKPFMADIYKLLLEKLDAQSILSPEEASKRPASLWLSKENLECKALARPKTTEELSIILKTCNEHSQTIVPHSGLTSVARGEKTTVDDVAISLERMNKIEDIDLKNKTVTVQAGVILQDLQQEVAKHGLLFPLDLGAKGSCMIGGNISTNAGGLQALRYGVMRNLVLGLEAVLADGTVISSMNKMMKNNAGYDLKHLFIGSEGTLGIVTRAVLKLEDAPKSRNTALVALETFDDAINLLNKAKKELNNTLTTFEILWQDFYTLMTSSPSDYKPPLNQNYPYYVLLEALGQNTNEDSERFMAFLENSLEEELIKDATIAQNSQELELLWGIREKIELIFQVHKPVFLFDISLPITEMESYIGNIKMTLKKQWEEVYFFAFGHMGDGNLHLFITCGEDNIETQHKVERIVFEPLQSIGGSITAEHGVGLEKKPWLHLSRTPEEIALMRTLKSALDPKGILNRGKVI